MPLTLNCISLFSGGGGLDLGLESAGFETVFATDIDAHSCISLQQNKENAALKGKPFLHHAKILREDVIQLDGSKVLHHSGLSEGTVDLLAGGPPCQAFSVFGKRKGREDPRGRLAYHYLRLLKELGPKTFIFENVYGLITIEKGAVLEELIEKLKAPGNGLEYKISIRRLNAVDFGVPQFRDRIFIIGTLCSSSLSEIEPICSERNDLLSNLLPWRTVEDGLRGLAKIGNLKLPNHVGRKHSQRIIDRYASMKFGQRDHYTRINKLDPSRPSFAIIVGSDAGGGKGHIHPFEAREVTPRESARMQCFPDWWAFSGTSRHPIRQVGNAVPTLLGNAIGRAVIRDVFNQEPNSVLFALDALDQEHLFNEEEREFLAGYSHCDKRMSRPLSKQEEDPDLLLKSA